MRLKRIELAGFKSFVDPTKIDLGDGITAIVGPNGCGKSNIVDAIRWVLGEHSAKHLRGGVMDDLIFQGSDSRAPVGLCDVELTFAIEKGQLSPPYHDMEEISIRRRMTREAGSDAFINGKMVRLKDVVDVFLDTGISTRAYAIIEQGAIARMITAKPEERRTLFEEAAGVMKYRSRRREAERKMGDTRQNLERVRDLLDEVSTQCRSLKQQASRAERFKVLQDEFQQTQSLSMAIRYRHSQEQQAAVQKQLDEAQKRQDEVGKHYTHTERLLVEAREKLIAHEAEAQTVQDRLREAEQHRAGLQQQAERMAGDRRLLLERHDGLTQRIEETGIRIKHLDEEAAQLQQQLAAKDDAALRKQLAEAQTAVETAQATYTREREQRDQLFAEFTRLKSVHENAARRKQQAESTLQRLTQRQQALKEQQASASALVADNETALKQAQQQQTETAGNLTRAEQALNDAQAALDSSRNRQDESRAALAGNEKLVRELRGEIQELRAQLATPDVSDSLRDSLRSQGGTWVDESLQVPEGLENAVAAALRGQAADVVMPSGGEARKGAVENIGEAPVAMFVPDKKSAAAPGNLADIIGITAEHPLYSLFAGVALVEDILELPTSNHTCVSRDGWRAEADGWLIPPSQKRTARRLTLQRTLQQREKALLAAEKTHATAEKQFADAEAGLNAQQENWQQAHLALTQAKSAAHTADAQASRLQAEAESLQGRLGHITTEAQEVGTELSHWQVQLTEADKVDISSQQKAQTALDAQTEKQGDAEQRLNQAKHNLSAAQQALALHNQALEQLQRELQRLEQETKRLGEQNKQDNERLAQTREELEAAEKQQGFDSQLSEAAAKVDAAHQALNTIRQRGHELQQGVHEAEKGERKHRGEQQQASDYRQSIEVEMAAARARLQDLAEEITNRFQLQPQALLKQLDESDEEYDARDVLAKAQQLEERINRFGPVNLLAIEEFDQATEREKFLSEQAADLDASLATLTETITRIDRTTRQRFRDVFEQTNEIFQKMFPKLFGGGRAELQLDSDDVLTAGVEVIAQPPGKRLQDIALLSGGEKALTAVALVFSIFRIKPAPFCILDEVDAPLDDANVGRFSEMIREFADQVQFLAISHNKITMQQADRLVGVSMPEPGVSRIVSVEMD